MSRPHGQRCECPACFKRRVLSFNERLRRMGGEAPPSPEHMIPVKPHWRRNPNYLSHSPLLRAHVKAVVAQILGRGKKK